MGGAADPHNLKALPVSICEEEEEEEEEEEGKDGDDEECVEVCPLCLSVYTL